MKRLNKDEMKAAVDVLVEILTTENPLSYEVRGLDNCWFFINNSGNVAIDLRHIEYSIFNVLKLYSIRHKPFWGSAFKDASSYSQSDTYNVYKHAMKRKAIKDYKKAYLNSNMQSVYDQLKAKQEKLSKEVERKTTQVIEITDKMDELVQEFNVE